MSDEHDGAGSAADDGTETPETGERRGRTAVAHRPLRPTGKRSRRGAAETDEGDGATELTESTGEEVTKNGRSKTKKPKTAKKGAPRRNPIAFVWNYLKQVVAELRKVIWPNRKQMISYTSVVLVFLAFMVALIGGVDYGLGRLVMLIFG